MVCLTVGAKFFKEVLDYVNTSIVDYLSCDLKEQGKVISFRIR